MLEKLERLGLATVQDLLFHLPLRYEDRTQVWPIGDLPPGLHGAVEGEIQDTQLVMGAAACWCAASAMAPAP